LQVLSNGLLKTSSRERSNSLSYTFKKTLKNEETYYWYVLFTMRIYIPIYFGKSYEAANVI